MKTVILVLLLFVGFVARGQEMSYHPYRKVGENYHDLRPIYQWYYARQPLIKIPSAKMTAAQKKQSETQPPMKEWVGVQLSYGRFGYLHAEYYVQRVLSDGLIVRIGSEYTWDANRLLVLKNYPSKDKVSDGKQIIFLAMKTGNYAYQELTLPLYDYGIPYDPQKLAADSAATNKSAVVKTNQ